MAAGGDPGAGRMEARLADLGHALPDVPEPAGAYVPAIRTGNLVFTAGQLPLQKGHLLYTGKVGDTVTVEEAQGAARACILNALAAVKAEVGSLDAVRRVVKVNGYVASAPGFDGQPAVLNGASELLGEVFGDADGRHARTAVGVAELPLGAPVEIDLVVELDERDAVQ